MPSLAELALPFLHRLEPERAHALTLLALKSGLGPRDPGPDDPVLATRLWGMDFRNPLGLAAGFDKNAEVPAAMLRAGLGFVEVGSITPRPQAGNPRPRVFRLPRDGAVINRLGFNNEGVAAAQTRLGVLRRRAVPGPVGVNLGKNKDSEDAEADYGFGAWQLGCFADYLVINVSSPNTPGLRALQDPETLVRLVRLVRETASPRPDGSRPPILVKLAPDLAADDKPAIAEAVLRAPADGLIVSNTTVARPEGLAHADLAGETGGLSGRPLFAPSTALLAEMAWLTERSLPLIGVGGVMSGADAYAKIRAGASLVQLYTGLILHGPALIVRIKTELAALLKRDGFAHVADAVGADLG